MKHQGWLWILIPVALLILGVVVLLPIFAPGMIVTDDGDWMIIRLSAFYQSLREGQFPVRFLGRLNNGYGYPVANFLYPGYLYLGSILHLFGLSFSTAVQVIIVGSVIATSLFVYVWLSASFTPVFSFLGAATYLFSPYLIYDIYRRGSVGEVFAGAWIALALVAIDRKKRFLLAPAIFLTVLSHNTIGFLGVGFLVGYCIVRKRIPLLIDIALGIAMASFFWIPAIFEQRFVKFNENIISSPKAYFDVSAFIVASYAGMAIPFAILIERAKRVPLFPILYFAILFLFAISVATKVSGPIWNIALLGSIIQFPFRILFVTWFVVPYLLATTLVGSTKRRIVGICLAVLVPMVLFAGQYSVNSHSVVRDEGYYSTNEASTTVKDEYMPKWVRVPSSTHAFDRYVVFKGNAQFEKKTVSSQRIDVIVHAKEDSIIQINTVFYPGWGALLDGRPVPIEYDNEYGVMRIFVPTGTHHLFVEFRETVFRFTAGILSVIAVIIWIIYVWGIGIRRKLLWGNKP